MSISIHRNDPVSVKGSTSLPTIIQATQEGGATVYKDGLSGRVVAVVGWAGVVANLTVTQGWPAFCNSSEIGRKFLAVRPTYRIENLPCEPGICQWKEISAEELLRFADSEIVMPVAMQPPRRSTGR